MLRRSLLLPLAGLLAFVPLQVAAQSGTFTVSQNGSVVGSSTFDVKATPKGYDSSSIVRVSMQGLNYSLSKTETLDSANRLQHIVLSGIVNGSAVSITARPADGKLLLNISANGRSSTSSFDAHPNTVVLADFDAGALETLLIMATQQNNRDLWAIVPKGTGSLESVRLATYADQQGTYEGKAVTAHHLVATIGSETIDLFSGPENQLLQAELAEEGFALVRKGFTLTPPAKPGAPPSSQ